MNKQFVYDTFVRLRADSFLHVFHRAPCVLFYHGVAEMPDSIVEQESIALDQFERQMEYLRRNFVVVSPQLFYQHFINQQWDGREVLLTFDDGYKNMLTTALPVLERYGFPFLLFLTTNNISHDELFATTVNRLVVLASSLRHLKLDSYGIDIDLNRDNRLRLAEKVSKLLKSKPLSEVELIVEQLLSSLSKDEVRELRDKYSSVNPMNWSDVHQIAQSPLCTIGSHGMDHICCHSSQLNDEIQKQITQSKHIIERELDTPCCFFSYPNGSYTDESNSFVQKAGYLMGFSTKRRPINSLTQWNVPRQHASYDYSRFVYSLVTYPSLNV